MEGDALPGLAYDLFVAAGGACACASLDRDASSNGGAPAGDDDSSPSPARDRRPRAPRRGRTASSDSDEEEEEAEEEEADGGGGEEEEEGDGEGEEGEAVSLLDGIRAQLEVAPSEASLTARMAHRVGAATGACPARTPGETRWQARRARASGEEAFEFPVCGRERAAPVREERGRRRAASRARVCPPPKPRE